jgi:hypothetical protein
LLAVAVAVAVALVVQVVAEVAQAVIALEVKRQLPVLDIH